MFCTSWFAAPQYVVKIVEPDAQGSHEEAAICEFLQQSRALEDPDPDNHTIPCDVVHVHAEKTVLVMPYLPSMKAPSAALCNRLWLKSFLELAYQLLEVPPGSGPCSAHRTLADGPVPQGIDYLHRKRIAHMVRPSPFTFYIRSY